MTRVEVSLPDALQAHIEKRVAEGRHTTPSDYIQALIQEDLARDAHRELEAKLLEALDTPASEMTKEDWTEIRREGLAKIAAKKAR